MILLLFFISYIISSLCISTLEMEKNLQQKSAPKSVADLPTYFLLKIPQQIHHMCIHPKETFSHWIRCGIRASLLFFYGWENMWRSSLCKLRHAFPNQVNGSWISCDFWCVICIEFYTDPSCVHTLRVVTYIAFFAKIHAFFGAFLCSFLNCSCQVLAWI